MGWADACTLIESLGGRRHKATISIKPRAFLLNGSWRAIPDAFSDTGDAALPRGRSGLLTTRMADRLAGQSPQVLIGRGKYHLRMSALGTANVPGLVYLDGLGREIGRRYNGAWQGADLEWIDIGHRVRKHVYLHAGHPSVFELRIDDRAGNLVASPRGWDLLDDAGNPVLWAGPGYLFKPDDPTAATIPVTTTVRVQGGKSIYRYVLPDGNLAGYALDPTWSSQPGAAEGKDTGLAASYPDLNYGTLNGISSGNLSGVRRALLQILLTGLSGAAQSATLTLQRIDGSDVTERITSFHCTLVQWWEGIRNSEQPPPGEDGSTWNLRNTNGSLAWGAAGGQSGTDYAAVATASTSVAGNGAYTWNVLADVAAWLAGTANWGGFIKNDDEVTADTWKQFASSDHDTAAWRPSLTVEYTEARRRNRLHWFGLIGGMVYAA